MVWTDDHASLKNARLTPHVLRVLPLPTIKDDKEGESSATSKKQDLTGSQLANTTVEELPTRFFSPQFERQPALWRAFWGISSSDTTTFVTRAVDGVAADWQHPTPFPQQLPTLSAAKERLTTVVLEQITEDWLPTLVLIAALEQCQAAALDDLVSVDNNNIHESGSNGNGSSVPFYYYTSARSNSGMARTMENAAMSSANSDEHHDPMFTILPGTTTAVQLCNRIKQGCLLAWQAWLEEHPPAVGNSSSTAASLMTTIRTSRRLKTTATMVQQAEEDEEAHDSKAQQRRWPVMPGGLVARYLQQELAERQGKHDDEQDKEKQDEEDTKQQQDATATAAIEEAPPRPVSKKPSTTKEERKEKARKAADSKIDGDDMVQDDDEEDESNGQADDEAYEGNPEEEEDDEEMSDVVQENLQDLQAEDSGVDEDDDNNTEEGDEEEDDDEDADLVSGNPYLQASETAILEWLGKKTAKFLSTNELQDSLQALMWRTTKKKKVPTGGADALPEIVNLVPPVLWKRMVQHVAQTTKTDPKDIDLEDARLALFVDDADQDGDGGVNNSRSPISIRLIWAPHVAQQRAAMVAEQEFEEVARRKLIQAWATWRYKGIGQGCTLWSSWKPEVGVVVPEDSTGNGASEPVPQPVAAAPVDDPEPLQQRRSRKSNSVYYGNQSNMTQKQLMDALLRMLSAEPASAAQLATNVTDDSTDPLRRIRLALGKLLCKRRQVMRIAPAVEWEELATSHDNEELGKYLQHLHETEWRLRQMVLRNMTEFTVPILATCADERKGSMEAMDEEDLDIQDWQTSGHDWIGKDIFRPPNTSHADTLEPCQWYKVDAVAEPIAGTGVEEEEKAQIGWAREAAVVERRRRFRVVYGTSSELILTEAQVFAGLKAAELHQKTTAESPVNPFVGAKAVQITLVAPSGPSGDINGVVVGHDTFIDKGMKSNERILILPERENEESFWARLIFTKDGAIECTIEGKEPTVYSVQQYEYHSSSPAFQECRAIVQFMERHASADIFLEPVDPVALNIPDYFNVIKSPMDISTLSSNLENGKYSNIPPQQAKGRTAIARMLNGPFRRDVELIFDNAMLFNPPGDWIHTTAASFKRGVLRKIDAATTAADRSGSRSFAKQSIYVDDDSDVDMYEYESDEDYSGEGRRGRKRKQSASRTPIKEDSSTRYIERPVRIAKLVSEQMGLRGSLANIPVQNDAMSFSIPPDWSCRRKDKVPEMTNSADAPVVDTELDGLIAMKKSIEVERAISGTASRRTTRYHPQDTEKSNARSKKTVAVEYSNGAFVKLEGDNPLPDSREQIEIARERLHEECYAKLFQQVSKQSSKDEDSSLGGYLTDSFPPYLGRVVPPFDANKSPDGDDSHARWEIRSQYMIPALRWVIRGLVRSNHLSELEPIDNALTNGVIIPNYIYYIDPSVDPFDVVDVRELTRRKRAANEAGAVASSDEEVELSEYEQRRAERVARNAERLKALGLT